MWQRFIGFFAATVLAALTISAAAIALIDPLAVSPLRIVSDEFLPQTNRRYLVPAIVRSGRYDGFLVGTSTVHSLDPLRVADRLGGTFANLALHGATLHEQAQVVRLIGRRPTVRSIFWGLDSEWCRSAPADRYNPATEFPEWLYDENRWNDVLYSFNLGALNLVLRKVGRLLRPRAKTIRPDGFQHLLPPDTTFDIAKAQKSIYGGAPPRKLLPMQSLPPKATAALDAPFPGVAILDDALATIPATTRVILVLMPRHASALPPPGSSEDAVLQTCKAAIAASAERRGDWVIDTMWHSAWTVDDYTIGIDFTSETAWRRR